VVDTDRLGTVMELLSGPGGLDTDIAVRSREPSHVVGRSIHDVERPEAFISEPSEHVVVESNRIILVHDGEFDVVNTSPAHDGSLENGH